MVFIDMQNANELVLCQARLISVQYIRHTRISILVFLSAIQQSTIQ